MISVLMSIMAATLAIREKYYEDIMQGSILQYCTSLKFFFLN
jgi:hypothetical protein